MRLYPANCSGGTRPLGATGQNLAFSFSFTRHSQPLKVRAGSAWWGLLRYMVRCRARKGRAFHR
jgi:hypothetical protein